MECRDIQEKLPAYLDRTIAPEDQELIEQHLASCRACSAALADLQRAGELVKGLEEVDPPAWMKPKIMARVREESEKKRGFLQKLFFPLHIKVPLEAVAMVLIAVIAVYVFRAVEPETMRLQLPVGAEKAIQEEARKPLEKAPAVSESAELKSSLSKPLDLAGKEKPESLERESKGEPARPSESVAKDSLPALGAAQPAPTQTGELPATDKKKEALVNKEDAAGMAALPKKQAVPPQPYAPAPAAREEQKLAAPGAGARDLHERRAPGAAPSIQKLAEKRGEPVALAVRVQNVASGSNEAETLLRQLGARRVEREPKEGSEVITAEIEAREIKNLLEKLKALGEVTEKAPSPPPSAGSAQVRIEILPIR